MAILLWRGCHETAFLNGGTLAATVILATLLIRSTPQDGIASMGFLWSAVICLLVLTLALTFRYLTELRSGSHGPRPNHHRRCCDCVVVV